MLQQESYSISMLPSILSLHQEFLNTINKHFELDKEISHHLSADLYQKGYRNLRRQLEACKKHSLEI
jgi:hypothetical protein